MRRLILILCIGLLQGMAVRAQSAYPFGQGEELNLSVMFKWGAVNTEVGIAQLKVDSLNYKGTPVYHLDCKAWTAPFFDRFYKIREDLQSWAGIRDLQPVHFTRNTLEGSYTATNSYVYDWKDQVIRADINFENKGRQRIEIPLKPGDLDLISLFYTVRSLDGKALKSGAKTLLRFAIDDDVYDVHITAHGEETIKVRKMGRMKAWHLSCSVVQGALFDGNEHLHLWISADENRIPVAARVPLKVGRVEAWLKGYSGLQHPFDAWTDGGKR